MIKKYENKPDWESQLNYKLYDDSCEQAVKTECYVPQTHNITKESDLSGLYSSLAECTYEYVHSAYGLGHAVEYTHPKIAILFRKGLYKAIGMMPFQIVWWEALCQGKCPAEWDFTVVIEQEEKKVSCKTVGVSGYDARVAPRIIFK